MADIGDDDDARLTAQRQREMERIALVVVAVLIGLAFWLAR